MLIAFQQSNSSNGSVPDHSSLWIQHKVKFFCLYCLFILWICSQCPLDGGFNDIWTRILPQMRGHWSHGGQSPPMAPPVPGWGQVGPYLDRCIKWRGFDVLCYCSYTPTCYHMQWMHVTVNNNYQQVLTAVPRSLSGQNMTKYIMHNKNQFLNSSLSLWMLMMSTVPGRLLLLMT